MADLSDISNSLVALIGTVLYPNGQGTPCALGSPAHYYAGWPIPTNLDADLGAAIPITNVSVYPATMNRNTTRYLDQWQQVSVNTATLGLTVAGQTVTVGGTAPLAGNPHNLSLSVNGLPYVYQASVVDSLGSIARKLAALIPGAISNGAVITLPGTARIGALRVGVTGVSSLVTRNQEQVFQIGIWAATPATRDLFAKTIDGALAQIRRFTLPDTSVCRLIWKNSLQSDKWQKQAQYRRDLFYTAEYATLAIENETQITQIQENYSASVAGVDPAQFVGTVYE
ncbi:MAG: hypothetical protein JWO52_4045 [Gammaproteobacteria bacterium]|nr:hypothetical protein [Gammaproteobacteria bacterium]